MVACKAPWADRSFIAVNPAHTSQDCSGCRRRKVNLTLADRGYHCAVCGVIVDRDLHAALHILPLGQQCLGLIPRSLRLEPWGGITELVQLEQQLAASAGELQSVFEAMTDGIVVFDAQGRILHTNCAFTRLWGMQVQPTFATLLPTARRSSSRTRMSGSSGRRRRPAEFRTASCGRHGGR